METKFEDSNIALLNSDIEHALREKNAQNEPEWHKIPKEPCTMIWRIEKFAVVAWPKEQYGNFYQGDSYIVLNIIKDGDTLEYTAHMWVGKESTQDERGTAAYKIVELDDFFKGGVELVYQEQGSETEEFTALFQSIIVMEGGIASGFRKVEQELYKPRLLLVSGSGKNVKSEEVALKYDSLNNENAYILDGGMNLYIWRGEKASPFTKFGCTQICNKIKASRNDAPVIKMLEEGEQGTLKVFKEFFGDTRTDDDIKEEVKHVRLRAGRRPKPAPVIKKMFKLSDETGKLEMSEVEFKQEGLDSNDAFLIDNGKEIFIWVGEKASPNEKRMGLAYAQKYMKETKTGRKIPITLYKEGSKKKDISVAFQ